MIADTLMAVLWDMDGTVIDSEPLWLHAEQTMLARYGLEMDAATQTAMIGSGLTAAAQLFQRIGVPLSVEQIISEWASSVVTGLTESDLRWRPGAVELLQSLQDAGIPCALVTMATRRFADAVISRLPQGVFQAVIAGDEVAHEKPHPEPYLRGAAALGVPIPSCLAIEDSPNGLRSANASGAVTVGVPNLVPLTDAPHDVLLPTLHGVSVANLQKIYVHTRENS